MTLTDEQFNKALEIFQEFGPRRRIPVHQRWTQAFPEATVDDLSDWEALFRELEKFAYKLAEKVRDGTLAKDQAILQISERFPRLSRDRVHSTYSQAIYYSMV